MEIRFFLTREDLWHFLTYAFFRQRRRNFLLSLLMYVAFILFLVILPVMTNGPSFSLVDLWPLFILLIPPALLVRRWSAIAARGAGRGGEHVVSVTPEGIREKTDLGEGLRAWRTIKIITQDTYNLYLIADTIDSNATMAFVLPKRAFPTPRDAETFLGQARQHWMQGRGMVPAMAREISPDNGQGMSTNDET